MSARIGGTISDMLDVASKLETAGSETDTMTSAASGDAQVLVDEVGDVTSRMLSQFENHASALMNHITAANNQLGTADWDGRSREAANQAENDLRTQVTTTLDQAGDAIASFNTSLVDQVMGLKTEIDGSFARVLDDIKNRYLDLQRGTATVAQNFQDADNMTYG